MSNFPSLEELRRMAISDLEKTANTLRKFISSAGVGKKGHLQSSLSVTELTVALHHVFNTPEDVLIWDVGHQTYAHKALTGRENEYASIRSKGGLSGFPSRTESAYDAFGTGHSSTSISAIVGMALENKRRGNPVDHIAVIGDGALTGGMAFEALNYLGSTQLNVLVILNDNRKAIDANIGALHERDSYEMFFQSLGVRWMGHVNGNDMEQLVTQLRYAQSAEGPRVLHIETAQEILPSSAPSYSSELPFQDVFGEAVDELLSRYEDVTVISPAMLSGAGLTPLAKKYPNRVLDVAIAEQHAATMSAGIAAAGGRPILHLYSTFAQRAYDQIIHDIALQNLPVVMCIDRSGLVGEDGATHHGAFDLAFLRPIPNLVIASPRNGIELRNAVFTGLLHNGPFAIRYPRDTEARFDASGKFDALKIGKAEVVHEGTEVCIHATGTMSRRAIEAAQILAKENISVRVVHHLFIKPLDIDSLSESLSCKLWFSLEDSSAGGLGTAISEWLVESRNDVELHNIHLPDQFVPHGKIDELHRELKMDTDSLVTQIKASL